MGLIGPWSKNGGEHGPHMSGSWEQLLVMVIGPNTITNIPATHKTLVKAILGIKLSFYGGLFTLLEKNCILKDVDIWFFE